MEEKNKYRKPIEERDIPISVPSVEDAWNDMRKKLDLENPIAELVPDSGMKGKSKILFNGLAISITLFSIIAALFFKPNNINQSSQIGTGNKKANFTEKSGPSREADKISKNIDLQHKEPKDKSIQGSDYSFDSVLFTSPLQDLSKNENEQYLNSIVNADAGNEKIYPGYQLNKSQNKYSKSIKGEKYQSYFPTNIKQHKLESKTKKEKKFISNISVINIVETLAVANTNTYQVVDKNELDDSTQIHLVDSILFTKIDISGSDTSKMRNLYVSKNIGGTDTIENSGKWRLQTGLSWSLQLPFSGTRGYFQGPNTNSQPYRIFYPALWLQLVREKSMLSVEINPFISNLLPEKPFRTSTKTSYLPDTTITTTEIKTLYKVFGLSTSIGYNYNIGKNWWFGGNVQFCWWAKGIAYSKGSVQKTPVNGSALPQDSNFEIEYQISDEWSYFNRAQFFVNSDFLYRKEKWHAGITTGIAATPLAKKEGPGYSFRMALFYRLSLYTKR